MTQEAAASGTTTPVPQQRAVEQESAAGHALTREAVEPVKSVSFDRLLSVASLTPAQASLMAVQLLDAAHLQGPGDADPAVRACLGAVTVTPSGDVDASPSPADGGRPVSALLEQLLQNARRLPSHPRPDQLFLLHTLEEAVNNVSPDPGARARELERALTDTLGPGARRRLAGQLAALVDAFAHVAPGAPVAEDTPAAPRPGRATNAPAAISRTPAAPGSSRPAPHRAAPARPARDRAPRRSRVLLRRRTRGRAALIALVLAAVLAGSGYVVLGGPGSAVVGSLGRSKQPAAPQTTAPAQTITEPAKRPEPDRPPAVFEIAPRQAGPVTGVALQKAGSCKPGALCPVTVTVRFRPTSTTRTVGWKVGAAQVCKRAITWSPPITVTAQPGWTTVYASSSVRVPKGRSLALTALTTTPARAQSRPVPVTGSSLGC